MRIRWRAILREVIVPIAVAGIGAWAAVRASEIMASLKAKPDEPEKDKEE